MLHHVSLGSDDLAVAGAFYDAVLAALGYRRVADFEGVCAGYGRRQPEFWVTRAEDGARAAPGNGSHVCFSAPTRDAVHEFWETALEFGGRDAGAPGLRPQYAPDYYAAFVHDPDGHKIEALCIGA